MKKIAVSLLFLLGVFSAHARDIELVLYYPPGGGGDQQATLLVKPLADQGITAKKVFFKTCVESLNYVKNNKNAYLVGFNSDLRKSATGICPSMQDYPELKFYSTIADNTTMFCTAPSKSEITYDTLKNSKEPIIVGVLTADANWKPFHLFLKNSKDPLNIKVVPYKGAAEVRNAAVSGTIDAFFIGGLAIQMAKEGSKCIGASARTNWANATFLGDLTNMSNFPETLLQSLLYSNGSVDKELDNALKKVFVSDDFKQGLQKLSLNHSGLGVGRTTQKQQQDLEKIDDLYKSMQ